MSKLTCTRFDCKFCDDNSQCTAKEIELSSGNIATVWAGRQDVWWCESFEISDFSKQIIEQMNNLLKAVSRSEYII